MTRARDRLIMTYAASKLEDRLKEIALRMDMSSRELLTAYVNCPGSWVLMTALQRTEAGEFFNFADRPDCVKVQDIPWSIHVVQSSENASQVQGTFSQPDLLDGDTFEKMRRGLAFRYPYQRSTDIPSKLTATQLKGRTKDLEAAEFTATNLKPLNFRMPFSNTQVSRGTEYGNAMHTAMQYLNFDHCDCVESIMADVTRMLSAGLLSKEQADVLDLERICNFFQTNLGKKVREGKEVLREFKFSILENASVYYPGVKDDTILLQGVIDCALIEDDGIIILDFKTDFITESNKEGKISQYRAQVQTYAKALSKIYEIPVKASYIYFFSSDEFVAI